MPGMDGIQATSEIRRMLQKDYQIALENQPKIIGITGHVHNEFTQKGIDAGMNEVLSKPCYVESILKILIRYGILNNGEDE